MDAFDHRKRTARANIKIWLTKVSKWYSSNSKRTHIAVAKPSTPAEIFLFLQRNISAAATGTSVRQNIPMNIEY